MWSKARPSEMIIIKFVNCIIVPRWYFQQIFARENDVFHFHFSNTINLFITNVCCFAHLEPGNN